MTQAYIVDALRTLSAATADRCPPCERMTWVPCHCALMARHPDLDWAAVDDVLYGCANQAGEDNRNVARMAPAAGRAAANGAGRHHQPPVRVGSGCAGNGGARHQGGRGGLDDRRWGGKHEPRAVRDAQSGQRVLTQQRFTTPPLAGASSTS